MELKKIHPNGSPIIAKRKQTIIEEMDQILFIIDPGATNYFLNHELDGKFI